MTGTLSKNRHRITSRFLLAALGAALALLSGCQAPEADSGSTTETVPVVHVIDGDTLIIERAGQDERVRLLGIDAPEVARNDSPGEPCANEATALTEHLTASTEVTVVADSTQPATDRYGRTLAYVEAEGRDVSAELLRAGLAEVYYSAEDISRYGDYRKLAANADVPSCAEE